MHVERINSCVSLPRFPLVVKEYRALSFIQMILLNSFRSTLVVIVSFSLLSIIAADSEYRFYSIVELFNGVTRSKDTSNVNVGDKLSIRYTVQVESRTNRQSLCRELITLTALEVDPAANIFQNSSYAYDKGGLTEHNLEPLNPVRFIPRSKGPLKITATGTGCVKQHPHPWTSTKTIQVAGLTVEVLREDMWMANGASLHELHDILVFADERHPTGLQIPIRVTNEMSRPVKVAIVVTILRDQHYLVVNDRRLPIIKIADEGPALDPNPLSNSMIVPSASRTLQPGESTLLVHGDRPSMPLGWLEWRSPTKGGTYQGVGFLYSFQIFILQDWDKRSDTKVAQVPIGESVVEYAMAAQADVPADTKTFRVNERISRALRQPQLIPKANFAPTWSGPIRSEQFSRFKIVNANQHPRTLYFLLDDPPVGFGGQMPRMDPPRNG